MRRPGRRRRKARALQSARTRFGEWDALQGGKRWTRTGIHWKGFWRGYPIKAHIVAGYYFASEGSP